MKIYLCVFALTFGFSAPLASQAYDVFGTSSSYIKVTEDQTRAYVRFELCSFIPPGRCQTIGQRGYYSKAELSALRKSEKWDVLKSTGADVVLVLGTALTGGALAEAATAGSGVAVSIWGTLGGSVAGGLSGSLVPLAIDALNPYEQHMQLQTLNGDVLNDARVQVDYTCEKFAGRLATVLDHL